MKWNQNATRLQGYSTEQRGNWAGEHTAILSNVSNKQNLQMFVCTNDLWSYRNPRRLDECPLPNRNTQWRCHSPVEKKKKKKKHPFILDTSDSNARFKMSPRFFSFLFFFRLNISQLLIYFNNLLWSVLFF